MTASQHDLDFFTESSKSQMPSDSDGPCSKMSPVYSAAMEGATLLQWLESWRGAKLTFQEVAGDLPVWRLGERDSSNGSYWMHNGVEWLSDASVCSLSEILETGPIDRRFFLSPKACSGILRRAGNRGKELPTALKRALESVAMKSENHSVQTQEELTEKIGTP